MHQLNENCSTSLTCDMYLFGFVLKELILLKIMYAIIYNFWFLYYLMYCYLFISNLKIVIFGIFTTIMLLLYFVLVICLLFQMGHRFRKIYLAQLAHER